MYSQPPERPFEERWGSRSGSPPPSPSRGYRLYQVVLHDSIGKDLMFVVQTVMELLRYGRAEATHRMWQAHHFGRSLLLVAHQERAELYLELFHDRGLSVSLEPA